MAKGPDAFRTISEAAVEVGVAQHVLRFWETRFSFIKPMKRAGGRRFYRPRDIAILKAVHRQLHIEGLSITEVQKLYRAGGLKSDPGRDPPPSDDVGEGARARLRAALGDLMSAKADLDRLLGAA